VRLALGATRARIVRLLIAENLVLAGLTFVGADVGCARGHFARETRAALVRSVGQRVAAGVDRRTSRQ